MSRELRPAPLLRCALVWIAGAVALAALVGWLLPDLLSACEQLAASGVGGHAFDEVLVWLCEAALLGAGAWLWLVTGLVVRDAARGRVAVRRGVPAPVRRLVQVACGAALAGALAAPSYAAPAPAATDRAAPERSAIQGLPLPDRATTTTHVGHLLARQTATVGRPEPARPPRTVVVRPGDTLWGLADETLAPGATADAVSERWRQIYRANRAVIGADPDLILPDQRLRLPRR